MNFCNISPARQALKTKKSFAMASLFIAMLAQPVSCIMAVTKSRADWISVINGSALLTTATSALFFLIISVFIISSFLTHLAASSR